MKKIIDLSGEWKLFMDSTLTVTEPTYCDDITLPDTTSNARKGEPNNERPDGYLTDIYKFEGNAWFSRRVDLSECEGSTVKLFLERTRITELFVDGKSYGVQESLVAPHIYDLSDLIGTGEHELAVRVCNVGYKTNGGHLTSPDTQTNWNGITGRIELQCFGEKYLDNVMIFPNVSDKTVRITADLIGGDKALVSVSADSFNGDVKHHAEPMAFEITSSKLDCTYPMGDDCLLWSEHHPNLYYLRLDIYGDVYEQVIGMRDFSQKDGKFTINGKNTFLRGKHDGMIFPKTGYAPTDLEEWLKILEISKSYGINHYRYHTCCPPEAAFLAADMLGIYMEPQLPFWGTITTPDDEKHDQAEQDFLIEEGFNMLRSFGNHPSYCMMSLGNELWGSKEILNDILGRYKAFDNRHLYTQGSNNFQWFPNVLENDDFFVGVRLANDRLIRGSYAMCDAPLGHIQTDKPSTLHDYDSVIKPAQKSHETEASEDGTVQIQYGTTMKTVKASEADADFIPEVPIVTHEIGQFETYPDYDEMKKYTGPLKPRNFEIFRERLRQKGLLHLAKDYFECSGKLAVACYKEELEAAFRSKLLAGFQVLDIQDFTGQGTALVGILDAFMDSKGLITPDKWKGFCNDAVLLARFDDYVLVEKSTFSAKIQICSFRDGFEGGELVWKLSYGENMIADGRKTFSLGSSNYLDIADISVQLPAADKITYLTLSLSVENTDISNEYELTVVPITENAELDGVYLFREVDAEADKLLSQGKTVLIVPDLKAIEEMSVEGMYCQDFWCYPMFRTISDMMKKPRPIGTMGLLIDTEHPALSGFGSKKYSTPQWFEIVQNSRAVILDDRKEDINVIVRTIDNVERNHSLSLLYEYERNGGKVVVCACDIEKLAESPEGRAFVKSVFDHCRN
ncbi:MAG: beta-glucuronidase [Ruminococcus sp.]|nr:beta-glucuronidase [Ruminococcus sp.]